MFFKFTFHHCTLLFIILIISGYITSNRTSTTMKTTAEITTKTTIKITPTMITTITPKTTTKITPKTTTKITPKTTTKITPKTTTKITPKTTTKMTPKTTTKMTPKTTTKMTPKTTTKITPKTTTKTTPKSTTKTTPKTTTKITPKTTTKTTPKTTTKTTPKPPKTPTTLPPETNFTLWDTPTGCNLGFRMRDMGMIPHIVTYFPKHVLKVIYELEGVTLEIQHINRGVYFNDSVLHDKPTDVEYLWDDFENYTLFFTFINVTNQSIESPDKFINHTQYHHWLIYNIPGYNQKDGIEYFKYQGPPPMRKQEYRLYIFLLFKQKRNFIIADNQNQTISNATRSSFTINEFIKKYDLDSLHSANYLLQSVTNE